MAVIFKSAKYISLLVLFFSSLFAQGQYCATSFGGTDAYAIHRVRFKTIDNVTDAQSANGYGDFSAITASVNCGEVITLRINAGGTSNARYSRVWIDWDDDKTFETIERINLTQVGTTNEWNATITVPPTSATSVRMRINYCDEGYVGACYNNGSTNYGEAEDYTLNINPSTPMSIVGVNVVQNNTSPTERGSADQEIIGINVETIGCSNPWYVKSVAFKSADSDDLSRDAFIAKLFYTSSTSTFATDTRVGVNTPPTTSFEIKDVDVELPELLEGNNWFWMTYKIRVNAQVDDFVDGEVEHVVLSNGTNDTTIVPTNANPAGKRQIVNSYCPAVFNDEYDGDRIDSVSFGAIHNTNGGRQPNGYSDFTLTDIDTVSSGTFKTINVTGISTSSLATDPGSSYWLYAFFDWNRDGTFDQENEKYFIAEIPGNSNPLSTVNFNESLEVNIPGSATSGFTRMRVRLFDQFPQHYEACVADMERGEAEDYGIYICGGASVNSSEWTCVGESISLTASDFGASSVEWQMSDSVNGTWSTIATTATTNTTLNGNTFFRALIQEPGCPVAYSDVLSASTPEITDLTVTPASLCENDTATIIVDHTYKNLYKEVIESVAIPDGRATFATPGTLLTSALDFSGDNIVPNQNNYYSIDSVCLNVTHSNVEDLRAYLVHQASGKRVFLFDEDDLSGTDLVNTCFGPMATSTIDTQTDYTGLFLPVGDLNAFAGVDNSSIWELHIQDMDGGTTGGTGNLDSWSIKFGRVSPSWSPTDSIVSSNADSTNIQVNPASDTTFVVSLIGAACSLTDTAAIIVIPQVDPIVSIDNIVPALSICTGDSITFFGTSNVHPAIIPTYEWYVNSAQAGSDSTSFGIRNLNDGDTVVFKTIVNSSCGAFQSADTVYVEVVSAFTSDITLSSDASFDTLACSGDIVTFSADTINPGGAATFAWYVNDILVSNTDTFYVNAGTLNHLDEVKVVMSVSESCALKATVADSLVMDIQPSFDPSIDLVVDEDKPIYCLNELIEFTANITDGGPSGVLEWYHNNVLTSETNTIWSTDTFGVGAHTIEAVYVTNTTCSPTPTVQASFTFDVANSFPPTVTIDADTTRACQGTQVNLFVKDIINGGDTPTYQWRLNGTNIAGATQSTYSSNQFIDGVILSVEINSNSLCASPKDAISNDIQIEILQNATPQVTIEADENSICENQPVNFNVHQSIGGGANPTYQWQLNGADIPNETGLTFTTSDLQNNDQVTVAMTSDAICLTKEVDEATPVTITVNDSLLSSFSLLSSNDPLCDNEASLFTVTDKVNLGSNSVYEWSLNGNVITGETTDKAQIGNLKGGDIVSAEIEVKGLKCLIKPIVIEQYTVNQHPVLNASFTADSVDVLTYAFKNTEPMAINWYWDFGNGFSSNVQNPQHQFNKAGEFDVCLTITDQFGCDYTECEEVEVLAPVVSVNDIEGGALTVYPNPVKNTLFIASKDYVVHSVVLRNLVGKEVLKISNPSLSEKFTLNMAAFPAGIYILDVQYNTGIISKKVTVLSE